MHESRRVELLRTYLELLEEVSAIEQKLGIGKPPSSRKKPAPHKKKKQKKAQQPAKNSRVIKFPKGSPAAKKIQKRMAEWRESKELTQSQVSKMLEMSAGGYAQLEREHNGITEGIFMRIGSKMPSVIKGVS